MCKLLLFLVKIVTNFFHEIKKYCIFALQFRALVAELVDALDSKSSSGNRVWVRFPPKVQKSPNKFCLGFFLVIYIKVIKCLSIKCKIDER